MKDKDIDLIIVSPLRRALKTCHLIFDGHKDNPKVIVDPAFREVLCSSNDIGSKLEESRQEFTKFDFSLITDPDFWYLHNLHDE
jgi:broad specificity phosphatase PhoE